MTLAILTFLDANVGADDLQDAYRVEAELIVLVPFHFINNVLGKVFP